MLCVCQSTRRRYCNEARALSDEKATLMAGLSDIEWTQATWNPVAGCKIVSPGCTNCYAQRLAARLQSMHVAKYQGTTRKSGKRHVWTGRVNLDTRALEEPLHWRRPLRIFVNSMSDLFQDAVAEHVIASVLANDAGCPLAHVSNPNKTSRTYARRALPIRLPEAVKCVVGDIGRELHLSSSH